MPEIITEYPHFFTATNLEWKPLLQPDKYKDIIIESLRYLVNDGRVMVYGFVIMPNHVHIVWHLRAEKKREHVQRDFLRHTAQTIKEDLQRTNPEELKSYLVNAKDRKYQLWERNALTVELWTEKVIMQKLNYIHQNPVRAGLCKSAEEWKYSSAKLYLYGKDEWGFLTHLKD